MVVALCTAHRQSQEDVADVGGEIVEGVLAGQQDVGCVALVGPHPVESRGHDRFGVLGKQLVSGDLFLNDSRVGPVLVEGPDDVIAVTEGLGPECVGFETIGFGITDQVEPVATLCLSVMRAGQQSVDNPRPPAVWFGVAGRDLEIRGQGAGGQPQQVDGGSAEPDSRNGPRCETLMPLPECLEQERVDGGIDIVGRRPTDCGDRGTNQPLERPTVGAGRGGLGGRKSGRIRNGPAGCQHHQSPCRFHAGT